MIGRRCCGVITEMESKQRDANIVAGIVAGIVLDTIIGIITGGIAATYGALVAYSDWVPRAWDYLLRGDPDVVGWVSVFGLPGLLIGLCIGLVASFIMLVFIMLVGTRRTQSVVIKVIISVVITIIVSFLCSWPAGWVLCVLACMSMA